MKELPRNFPWCEWRGGIRVFIAVTFLIAPLLTSAATVDTYAELTGKTVLAPFALPSLPGFSPELPENKTNAIALLEQEFSKVGISVVQDGPCFVRLVPAGERQADTGWMPLRGAQLHASANPQLVPAGALSFPATDANQVLEIYAELKDRTILRSRALPAPTIRFRNQCPLTRDELVYALETVLALNGLSTVEDGAVVQVVPTPLRSMIDPHAPTPQPGDKLFDPKKVPSMGYSNPRPQTKLERDLERWEKAFFEFMRLNGTRNSSAQHLLELYAGLTDKRAEPSKDYETSPIWFHVRTPLTRSELLYAIETTFALNNLEIAAGEENKIRLGPRMGPGKGVPAMHETRGQ